MLILNVNHEAMKLYKSVALCIQFYETFKRPLNISYLKKSEEYQMPYFEHKKSDGQTKIINFFRNVILCPKDHYRTSIQGFKEAP